MLNTFTYKIKLAFLRIGAFLKTDIRYILRQGSWMAGGEVINSFLSLALIVTFANLIPSYEYGIYKYVLSIYGIFALFGLSGANTAVTKSVAEGNEGIYAKALKTQMKWGLLGSLGLAITALYYFKGGNSVLAVCFLVGAAALPLFESFNTYQYILAGKKRFDLQTRYYTSTRVISTASLIVTLFLSQNVIILLLSYFLPYIIANIIFGTMSLRKIELNTKVDPGAITYMKHLSVLNAVSFAVGYLESIMIFHLLGPVDLAIFSMASAPVTRVQSFFSIIPDISLPKYVERPIAEIKATLLAKILKAMVLAAIVIAGYMLVVPFFFHWFLPQYASAIVYAQILALPLVWYPLALLARIQLVKGATKHIYLYNITESVFQIAIMFLAIHYFGLLGAAVGRILVSIIGYAILYHFFRKM